MVRFGESPISTLNVLFLDLIRFTYYILMMIKSFKCKETEKLYDTGKSRKFNNLRSIALRKLDMIEAAADINDLRSPPGNRLEALSGNRQGQHSIRINNQYRICFIWSDGAENVEIVDYH